MTQTELIESQEQIYTLDYNNLSSYLVFTKDEDEGLHLQMMQSSKAVFNNSSDSENNCTRLNCTQASSSKHLFYDTDEESYSSTSMPFSVESEEDFFNLFRILAKLVKTLVSLPIDYKKGQVPKIVLQPLKYDLSEKHVS